MGNGASAASIPGSRASCSALPPASVRVLGIEVSSEGGGECARRGAQFSGLTITVSKPVCPDNHGGYTANASQASSEEGASNEGDA